MMLKILLMFLNECNPFGQLIGPVAGVGLGSLKEPLDQHLRVKWVYSYHTEEGL